MSFFQEKLELLDEAGSYKSDYMHLLMELLYENGTSKEDIETIQNIVYSYDQAR